MLRDWPLKKNRPRSFIYIAQDKLYFIHYHFSKLQNNIHEFVTSKELKGFGNQI